MSNQLFAETLISLSDGAKTVGNITGKRPHVSTLHRWAGKGVSGVLLETIFANGQRWTSEEAIQRFLLRSTEAKNNNVITGLLNDIDGLQRASDLDRQAEQEGI